MSTLKEKLDRIRASFEAKAPKEALAVMHQATEDLRASGIMNRILKVGDSLPPFELKDTEGNIVESTDLLSLGPVVLSFYRGVW